jgi:hypothetical protein
VNEQPELELLVDIARLLKKYGAETFDLLAKELASPTLRERLAALLTTAAEVGRESGGAKVSRPKSPRGAEDLRSLLINLQQTDPEKATLLLRFYDDLMGKRLLPTARELQLFGEGFNPAFPPPTSRKKAVESLFEQLLPLPLERLREVVASVKPTVPADRSLEGWANLILDRDLRKKRAE